ncbi:MAG: 30S ribosomal protein S12 methylthiotransferase RimO [Chitinispirillia bacterium]
MRKVAVNNLGCSKNIVDGETIASYLQSCGFNIINEFEKADIIIVNTCTFIQEATEEAIHTILEMSLFKKEGSCSSLIVSGCFSERYRNSIKNQFPEVDLWIGVKSWRKEINKFLGVIGKVSYKRKLTMPISTQYIKIADGCSHGCTFCIIPSIRGSYKSRSISSIIKEASWLYNRGVKECIIVAQDTSYYGKDKGTSIVNLLEILLNKTKFPWIRMMYLHPKYISSDLLNLIQSEKRLLSYFDIPLQHISQPILKAMRRAPSDPKQIYRIIDQIRAVVSDATIRTSFIVGFPGEKNSHFNQLIKFIERIRFDKLGVFPYSPEEGTGAFDLKHIPHDSTAQKRCETLMDVQREISREIGALRIGSKETVIIDAVHKDTPFKYEGRTRGDAPEIDGRVYFNKGSCSTGEFVETKIVDADDYDLYAEIL